MEGFDWRTLRDAEPAYVHRFRVRFQDVDAAGFMFFARVLDYFHDAWVEFIEDGGLPYTGDLRRNTWGAPLRHVEADYLAPLQFGDRCEVGLVKAAWDRSNLYVGYRLTHGERVSAVGMSHHVLLSLPEMKRIEPPAEFVRVFERLTARGQIST